jgi:glycerol-3-phosphate dehydrogenase
MWSPTASDLVFQRPGETHIAFEAPDRGERSAEGVARLMPPVLSWDEATVDREITHYLARLAAERAAQAMLDDAASNTARTKVRDPRLDSESGRAN